MSSVTVVPTVEPSTTPPRVKLDVTDTGSPNLFAATVTRLDPDGVVRVVRTLDGEPLTLVTSGANRVGTMYDNEAPYGAPVTYSTLESPANLSTPVTVDEDRVWLIHPGAPALSMPISVAAFGARTRAARRGVYHPMGSKFPVVQTDGRRKAPESTIEINTVSLIELAQLEALTDDTSVLLLNVPADLGWGVPTSYISVGDIQETRLVDYAAEQRRVHVVPYLVVDQPVGGSQSGRTYVDLLTFSTYADLNAAYPTYADMLAGP
ncbi:hypothetical protein [Nocardioides sp.]|uniref:hypothetical protein n=1 Tax=Nocardioides sp. TaxID=35761 RepID=UPI003569107E